MKQVIFLEPVFKSMIWGGSKLKQIFQYSIPDELTGEAWVISAHKKGDCLIKNGIYKGKTLSWLWESHRELFGDADSDVFPLLTKIIDAKRDLSIQVHPDDDYAIEKEFGALGKTECWYVLDCEENSEIVIGHNALDKEGLKEMIQESRWNELIRVLPIKKGDFFQIEPGTVHAIKAGTLILETQQNSDITYRVYDYGRLEGGEPRELHVEKSLDVIKCPHEDIKLDSKFIEHKDCVIEEFIKCDFYTVKKITIKGEQEFTQKHKFLNMSVINGEGMIDDFAIRKGDHFILPSQYGRYLLKGELEIIIAHI